MQTGMEITRADQAGCPELLVVGRMDGYWSRHLEEAIDELMREGIHSVRVNLSKTEYISSAGIRVLLHALKQLSTVDGTLLVVDPSPTVQKVLDLAGLKQLLCAPTPHQVPAAAQEQVTRYEECCWSYGGKLSVCAAAFYIKWIVCAVMPCRRV